VPIPHVLHQIWLGPNPLPAQDAVYIETWKRLHPAWEHRLWTEDNLPEGVRPEVYERLRVPAERSDLLRLELVARYGGVYVDTDFEALRPLDPLLHDVDLFAAYLREDFEDDSDLPARINNAIFGAVPEHPALVRALAEARPRESYGYDKNAVGPMFLDRMLQGTGATLFDRHLFYPRPLERDGAVAYHHQARTWKDAAGLQRSLQVALRRRRGTLLVLRELEARGRLHDGPASLSRRMQWGLFRAEKFGRRVERKLRWEAGRARDAARAHVAPATELARARAGGLAPRAGGDVAVPKKIHLIWLHGEPPVDVARRAAAWRLANPGWAVRLWTEADVPDAAARHEVGERLRSPAERTDLLRLDVLESEGGVVVAPELRARRLTPFVGSAACFAAGMRGSPSTVLVGATPSHPAIAAAIAEQRPRTWSGYDAEATGSGALARAQEAGAEIVLVEGLDATDVDEASARAALRDEVLAVEAELASLEERVAELRRGTSG
jgi:inositol phosphorylceramide mannosyltransferase catalytic subunit